MDSECSVFWTKKAQISYFIILDYLSENWTKREMSQFINRVEMVLKAIQRNPYLFNASTVNKKVRKAFIDKNNSLFYSVNIYERKVVLLALYDNRQDPKRFRVRV
jgi:plasmid stabilization system protein ParE